MCVSGIFMFDFSLLKFNSSYINICIVSAFDVVLLQIFPTSRSDMHINIFHSVWLLYQSNSGSCNLVVI